MKTNRHPCYSCPKARKCEENELDYMCDDILKYEMKQRFMPMNEDEQRALLNMCVESYFELQGYLEKAIQEKRKKDQEIIKVQMETYIMFINLFNTPADELKEIGYDHRAVLKEFYGDEELSKNEVLN